MSACDGARPGEPARAVPTPEGLVASSAIAAGKLATNAIDPSDTHLVMLATTEYTGTVYSNTPIFNAQTGQTTTAVQVTEPPQTYRVEAGYDGAGHLVYGQYALDAPVGDPLLASIGGATALRVQQDRISVYDAEGLIDTSEGGPYPAFSELVDGDGGGGTLLQGVVLDAPPTPEGLHMRGVENAPYAIISERVETVGDVVRVLMELTPAPEANALPGGEVSFARGSSNKRVRMARSYHRRGSKYVLAEVVTELEDGPSRMRHALRFSEVRWHANEARDQARKERPRRVGGARPTPSPEDLGTYDVPREPDCRLARDREACENEGGLGTGTPTDPCPRVAGGANVVWVHGINSDPSTWGGLQRNTNVRSRVRCGVAVNRELLPAMPSRGHVSHEAQTTTLKQAVTASGTSGNVFIGHSQGGIVSRRAAQEFVRAGQGQRVRGVVTVGTPHQGANVVRNFASAEQLGFTVATHAANCLDPLRLKFKWGCGVVAGGFSTVITKNLMPSRGTDAARDLTPGSAALAYVNGTGDRPNETFPRYGIQHHVSKRWVWMRVAADDRHHDGGRNGVRLIDAWAFSIAVATTWHGFHGRWDKAAEWVAEGFFLYSLDAWYHQITAGNDKTDGVVEGRSQVYPGALRNIQARQPTSHTGETKTEGSAVEIREVMTRDLQIPERR